MNGSKDLQNYVLRIQKAIESLTTREQMTAVGNKVVADIVKRTRLGYGVEQSVGQKERLKSLSPKYVEFRKKFPQLGELTTPKKSNLTLTSSMLDSVRVTKMGSNSILIEPTGSDYRGISNMKKAEWNEEKGRPFLYMSEQEIQKARIFWLRQFSSLLKKLNLR